MRRFFVHAAGLAPAAVLALNYWRGALSANPLQDATFLTGDWALRLLVASLACSTLNMLFGWHWVIPIRRTLGLYGFAYAVGHFLIFIGLDYQFNLEFIWADLSDKRYILAGLAALLLLVPLAITSTRAWMRRLGRRWKHLHRLVYVAVPIAVVHYVWLVKADVRDPYLYGAVVALLLLSRLKAIRTRLASLRFRIRHLVHVARGDKLAGPPPPAKSMTPR